MTKVFWLHFRNTNAIVIMFFKIVLDIQSEMFTDEMVYASK